MAAEGLPFDVFSTTAPRALKKRAFVLIHGIGTSHRYMARLHRELTTDANVHSIDLPGFGAVPKPPTSPSVTAVARALGSLLDQLAVTRAVVIGHSMGVQWGVELGVIRPGLVSELVLIGPVTDMDHRSLPYQALMLARDVLGEPITANTTVFMDYLRSGPVWFLRQSRFMIRYPIEKKIGDLTMPVLVLRGGNDPIANTRWCRVLVSNAPQGRLVTVPSHRHVVQFTAPRAVAAATRNFTSI